jgi:3-methylcrotonyl-CoA carboxylase alpha subunit
VREGDTVGVFYDPMIAKLIIHGEDRAAAIGKLNDALAQTEVIGLTTNAGFLHRVASHAAFERGETDTLFIERHKAALLVKPSAAPDLAVIACACRYMLDEEATAAANARSDPDPTSPWHLRSAWRMNVAHVHTYTFHDPLAGANIAVGAQGLGGKYRVSLGAETVEVRASVVGDELTLAYGDTSTTVRVLRHDQTLVALLSDGRYTLTVVDPWAFEAEDEVVGGRLTALMPGRIVKVLVAAGDAVKKGQHLLIMEAMKMEHTIVSPRDGRIERVAYKQDDIVAADALLFSFAE